jgi:hypothetical protein
MPKEFNFGVNTCFFYKDGSGVFGFKTAEEIEDFINVSFPILKKYDKKTKKKLYFYDND